MAVLQWVFSLKGVVQNYSWGGFNFLPSLLGISNTASKPFAEYWMGAHPNHSAIIESTGKTLLEHTSVEKQKWLGNKVSGSFGSFPFLLKILDVKQMLSIQVHPSKESAINGFEAENKMGIALNAAHRNYKDSNHKPELMVALGDFWLLHGFKNPLALKEILVTKPGFHFLSPIFESGGYKKLYEEVMQMDQDRVNEILHPLVQQVLTKYNDGKLMKDDPDFWAARAALEFCKDEQYDRGIFSIYFFNLLHLQKGEGIYQPAGLPHAYLEGQNVEIMANSDNVLRAGLTEKHIDVNELMKHVQFEETIPAIIHKKKGHHQVYESPAEEFELHQYEFPNVMEENIQTESPEIWIIMEGSVDIFNDGSLEISKGEAVYILPGADLNIKASPGSVLFRAKVPLKTNL